MSKLRGLGGNGSKAVTAVGEAPVPSGTINDLDAVWGSGSDVWIAGANGTILRWRP